MPPPALPNPDRDRFLHAVRRCGLLSADRIDQLLLAAPPTALDDTAKLADYFVARDVLTHFQVRKLQQGTWQGLVLGPYQVLAPLGRGGMGTVYLARDTRRAEATSGRRALVGLKVLPPKKAREESRMLARFQREMDLAQRVSHRHLTKTYEVGDINGVHYIAMEYIRGMSLRRLVGDAGPLSVARCARLFSEIADGLQHAHEQGLVHRDLKPSNIMVTPNGHAKVLDLGLALAVDEELPIDKKIVGGQGYVVGTMDYIAPEQVDDPTQVDARADLYAMGCTMYFALTGQPPFPGGSSIDKMKRHRRHFADPIYDLNPTVPIEFARIIEKLMEKSPDRRYVSASAARVAILPWVSGDPDTPFDTDADQSEADAIRELERTHQEPEEFFDSVPVAVFADKRPTRRRPRDQDPEAGGGRRVPLGIIVVAGVVLMVMAAVATGLLLKVIKG